MREGVGETTRWTERQRDRETERDRERERERERERSAERANHQSSQKSYIFVQASEPYKKPASLLAQAHAHQGLTQGVLDPEGRLK